LDNAGDDTDTPGWAPPGTEHAAVVELSELIRELRVELQRAMAAGAEEQLRFELGPVELELTVAVSKEAGAGAKVQVWVVELGADGKASRVDTQRMKLTLLPKVQSTGTSPLIGGPSTASER
jgi:hypothetical protein